MKQYLIGCVTVITTLVLCTKTLMANSSLLMADSDNRLFSAVPNSVSEAIRRNECNPVKYENDEYVNGPAYINLGSRSVFAFLCEKYSPDGDLFYLLGIEIKEHITKHAVYDCSRVISLPPAKLFKPAGVFLMYKTPEHFANENKRYFLNGEEANVHYSSDDPLMTIDVSDGVGGVSYACIDQKWSYSVISP